jgi:hypothetical protein
MSFDSRPPLTSLLTAVALCGSGCYASATFDDGESGTRLRRVVVVPEDGEPAAIGWHDPELGQECFFAPTEDGRVRCVPNGSSNTVVFEDPDCTRPVTEAHVGLRCSESSFVLERTRPDGCGEMPPAYRFFQLEDEEVAVGVVYERTDAGCEPFERPVERVRRLRPLDPSLLVAQERTERVDAGGPLLRLRHVAEDGSTELSGFVDRARDAICAPRYVGPGLERVPCMPLPCAELSFRPACRAWAEVGEGCTPPELAYAVRADGCGRPEAASVFRVEEPASSEELAASECTVREGTFYRTTPADDAVVWLEQGWAGAGRLQPQVWRDDEGRELRRIALYWDRALEAPCFVQETVAGTRCVPGAPGQLGVVSRRFGALYADASCTQPASGSACDLYLLDFEPEGCGVLREVYRVGPPIARVYVDLGPGGCVPDDTITEGRALEAIPLESLARVERRIE